jgi:D-alanyl-D-alanine carboxypeptidase
VRCVANPRGPALLLVGVLAVAGCTPSADDEAGGPGNSGRPSPAASPAEPPEPPSTSGGSEDEKPADEPTTTDDPATLERRSEPLATTITAANAEITTIPDRQWKRIVAVGAWRPGCPAGRSELRRVNVNYVNFDGEVRRGTLVVNRDVARSVARVFTKLFEARFPIRKMNPVEEYGGDVNKSLAADNTSAYNCRQLNQINAPVPKSPHANGRAIDINPRENPWTDLRCDCWLPSPRNRERVPGPGVIVRHGLVWRLFDREGWVWQNIDVPDYMHFDTGYPSRPYHGPKANKQMLERQERRQHHH